MNRRNRKAILKILNAGSFWSDAGAAMGVLPRPLWPKNIPVDSKNRVQASINLLYIESEGKRIIVDTGLGNRVDSKIRKIYSPSDENILTALEENNINRLDIDYVILTHLHFDHAGGLISNINGDDVVTFPNAEHVIQQKEWDIALDPDTLNKAAYNYEDHLHLIDNDKNLKLVDGDYNLTDEVSVHFTGGHTNGFQIVKITEDKPVYYTADVLSRELNLRIPLCFSYDVCRRDTAAAKEWILKDLKEKSGRLILNHDMEKSFIDF